jgi:hypothetical protein
MNLPPVLANEKSQISKADVGMLADAMLVSHGLVNDDGP